MKRNPVKAALQAGQPQVGTWLSLGSIYGTRVLARVGFPWLTVDMEHSPIGIEQAALLAQDAAAADGPTAMTLVERAKALMTIASSVFLVESIVVSSRGDEVGQMLPATHAVWVARVQLKRLRGRILVTDDDAQVNSAQAVACFA